MSQPALRFKKDDGSDFLDWVVDKLGNIGRVQMCKRIMREQTQPVGDVPFYKIGTFGKQADAYIANELYKSYKEKYSFPKKGDILISAAGTTGRTVVYDGLPAYFQDSNIVWIDNNEALLRNAFLYFLYSNIIWNTENTTIARLYNDNLRSISISYPSIPEQTKIANFLTAVDEKITHLTQKHTLLTQYKKGVMQQIFSQQLRFKDGKGRDFPEWEIIELEKLAQKVNAKNKNLALNKVLTNSATQGIVCQSDYFDRDVANQNNLGGYYIVQTNDFVYNPRISANALVGPIKRNKLDTGVMSPLYTIFRFTNGNLDFFEQYFQTTHWHDYMKSVSNTGARFDRMSISIEGFFGLPLPYPSELEQTKIANFLTAIDDKITSVQTQLNAMKQYKQGLLQQMFI
jgi:type I restriction enzyme S subunit